METNLDSNYSSSITGACAPSPVRCRVGKVTSHRRSTTLPHVSNPHLGRISPSTTPWKCAAAQPISWFNVTRRQNVRRQMLGLANAEWPRRLMFAVGQITTCLHHPWCKIASPLWSISFNGLWAELRSNCVAPSIYLPRDDCNTCLSFSILPTPQTRSQHFSKTTPLEPYSIISHVVCRTLNHTDLCHRLRDPVRRTSTMGSIPDG